MSSGVPINPSYTWGVFTVAYTFSYLDRQILSLLVEPVRLDLKLTDVQIGLLQGFAFAIVLAIAGLPLGRLVDRGNRVRIAAIAVAFWSVMTAACAFAGSFQSLLICRAGVALGEAALIPAAYSIISDLFPTRRRGLAIGLFTSGAFIGAGLSLILSATLLYELQKPNLGFLLPGTQYAWQTVFIAFGLPGIAVALWVASLKEPPRRSATTPGEVPGAGEVRAYFAKRRVELASLYLCLGFTALQIHSYSAWAPSMMIRTFDLAPAAVGFKLGPLLIAAGLFGLLLGAASGDMLVRRGFHAARPSLMFIGALAGSLFTAALPFASGQQAALVLIAAATLCSTIVVANGPAALQDITPPRMRGISSAIGVMIITLVGMGIGPTLVGYVSQDIIGDPGRMAIALSVVSTGALLVSAALALVAGLNYRLGSANVTERPTVI
tara:strand:+ start:6257 stop:7570 length:1314 start_codon:yes stop_codon:yes gene_type:complete